MNITVINKFYSLYISNAKLKYSVFLKLNGSVTSTVNNIDSVLSKKADKAVVDEMVDQFKTEREELDKFKNKRLIASRLK